MGSLVPWKPLLDRAKQEPNRSSLQASQMLTRPILYPDDQLYRYGKIDCRCSQQRAFGVSDVGEWLQ